MTKLRAAIKRTFQKDFRKSWVTERPAGSCRTNFIRRVIIAIPKAPLPFLGIASQKNHIAVYHMGIYSSEPLLDWFKAEWPKHSSKKLDMGKSCIRFRKPEDVPVELIGELASKMTPAEWIEIYEGYKPKGK